MDLTVYFIVIWLYVSSAIPVFVWSVTQCFFYTAAVSGSSLLKYPNILQVEMLPETLLGGPTISKWLKYCWKGDELYIWILSDLDPRLGHLRIKRNKSIVFWDTPDILSTTSCIANMKQPLSHNKGLLSNFSCHMRMILCKRKHELRLINCIKVQCRKIILRRS